MASYNFSNSLLGGYQTQQPKIEEELSFANDNPFKDPSYLSRTTASGFTDTNHLKEEFEQMKIEGLDKLQDFVELNKNGVNKDNIEEIRQAQEEMMRFSHKVNVLGAKVMGLNQRKPPSPPESPPSKFKDLEDDIMSTISKSTVRPDDSASLIRPKNPGTRLTTYSGIRSSIIRGSENDDIVGGYELTPEDHLIEIDAINNIQKVYGLPRIFVDNRLNFLVHLHKPLQAMLTTKNQTKVSYPDPNSLEKLTRFIDKSKGKHREPHHELLYQVLKSTIDIRRMRIKANPFNLPILEVGMSLDDQLVFMCISELYAEFRTSWFHSMKNVEPPHFATDYVGVCSPTSYKRTAKQPQNKNGKRRGSSSILGSILSA